jgi:hypothetical protein
VSENGGYPNLCHFSRENKDKPLDTDYRIFGRTQIVSPKLILLIISKSIPCLLGLGLIGYWATFGQKWRKNSILITVRFGIVKRVSKVTLA